MMLKKVQGLSLCFCEDQDYKIHLAKQSGGNPIEDEFFLWMVMFEDGEATFAIVKGDKIVQWFEYYEEVEEMDDEGKWINGIPQIDFNGHSSNPYLLFLDLEPLKGATE